MSELSTKLYFKAMAARNRVCKLFKNERGEANIIAIVLVLAIVIALAIVFRKAIAKLFNTIWEGMTQDVTDASAGLDSEIPLN